MPSVFASANRSVVSAQSSVRCSASVHVRPVWRSHRINQSSPGCQKVSTRSSPLWFSRGSCTSCTAQRDSQQQPSECITPEIVPEDEHCDLQAHSQPRAVESNTRGPASWLLAGHQKKVSALLGFAGLSAASLIGNVDLRGPGSTLQAIAVLAAIVTIHEAGHFVAARSQGIHVSKFSIGFGPALLKFQRKEVEYALRAIPLGGFVAFPDDDPKLAEKYPKDDPNLLKNRPIKDRALVISAGIIANCIFAFSILCAQVSTVGLAESKFSGGVLIPQVFEGAVAQKAGMQVGDTITKLNGRFLKPSVTAVNDLVNYIKDHPNKQMTLTVDRKGEELQIPIAPADGPDGLGRIGVQMAANAEIQHITSKGPLDTVQLAGKQFGKLTKTVVFGLQQIVTNFQKTAEGVSGPVAIVAVGSQIARSDLSGLFQFAAIVNINLAVVNALPLPALDGGFLALLLAEAVRGKKLDQKIEQTIMGSGVLLLTLVAVVLIVRDTINLGSGKPFM